MHSHAHYKIPLIYIVGQVSGGHAASGVGSAAEQKYQELSLFWLDPLPLPRAMSNKLNWGSPNQVWQGLEVRWATGFPKIPQKYGSSSSHNRPQQRWLPTRYEKDRHRLTVCMMALSRIGGVYMGFKLLRMSSYLMKSNPETGELLE